MYWRSELFFVFSVKAQFEQNLQELDAAKKYAAWY